MASKLSEGLGEQVTCSICLEHYSDPRLLPCLHTYCRQCLENLLAQGQRKVSVVCPECREDVPILSGDVTKLKVNFVMNNLLSLLAIHSTEEQDGGKTELTCENCDSKAAAKGRCVNCAVFLCNVCFTAHYRLQALKHHQLMAMDEMKNTGIPVIEKQVFCEKHKGEVKKLFCNTCQELICRDCTIIDHPQGDGHQFNFIVDVADQHKQVFKTEVERASNTKDKIEAVLKSVQKMKENVEKTSEVTEKDIDDLISKQIRALEEKRAGLKETTRRIAAIKMKDLAVQEDVLVMQLTCLKSAIEFTEKVLANGGESDVLSISKQLTSRLSKLSEKPFPEDLRHDDPWQKKKTRLESKKELFLESLNSANIVDVIVDYGKCSVVVQRSFKRPVRVPGTFGEGFVRDKEFVIQIKNSCDENLKGMENRIQVIGTENNCVELTLPIRSLEDGTYTFQLGDTWPTLITRIQVKVDGKNIFEEINRPSRNE